MFTRIEINHVWLYSKYMVQQSVQTILLSILTSIITGGFVLVLVEIGNRKNRAKDRCDQIIGPFMHKLSSYFRFMSWSHFRIRYPGQTNENETKFKALVNEVSNHGSKLIVSGGDYTLDDFSAEELLDLCQNKINNIWYYHDRMHPCNLKWDNFGGTEDFIKKELKEIFPNYLSRSIDVNLVSKISGDFYTDIYQPVENEIFKYESYHLHYRRQTFFVVGAVLFVLMVLIAMLFVVLPIGLMQAAGVLVMILLAFCLLILGVETDIQIKYYNRFVRFFNKTIDYIKIKIFRVKIDHSKR